MKNRGFWICWVDDGATPQRLHTFSSKTSGAGVSYFQCSLTIPKVGLMLNVRLPSLVFLWMAPCAFPAEIGSNFTLLGISAWHCVVKRASFVNSFNSEVRRSAGLASLDGRHRIVIKFPRWRLALLSTGCRPSFPSEPAWYCVKIAHSRVKKRNTNIDPSKVSLGFAPLLGLSEASSLCQTNSFKDCGSRCLSSTIPSCPMSNLSQSDWSTQSLFVFCATIPCCSEESARVFAPNFHDTRSLIPPRADWYLSLPLTLPKSVAKKMYSRSWQCYCSSAFACWELQLSGPWWQTRRKQRRRKNPGTLWPDFCKYLTSLDWCPRTHCLCSTFICPQQELSDVCIYLVRLSDLLNVNLSAVLLKKDSAWGDSSRWGRVLLYRAEASTAAPNRIV